MMKKVLIIGTGAAGLAAAVQLRRNGIPAEEIMVVTEGLNMGTSINTGSDKQTYFRTSQTPGPNGEGDSPLAVAQTLFNGGSMHGDIALVEASLSARAFFHLAQIGVQFPMDEYGQYVGYRTDHDTLCRGSSIGPYTSRAMCESLLEEAKRLNISIQENIIAIRLLTENKKCDTTEHNSNQKRIVGAILFHTDQKNGNSLHIVYVPYIIFATGGPGGLFRHSVWPYVHNGGIGTALLAGAKARNLPEFQFGLASITHRWNVSGSYMQVIPRFISVSADGISNPQEFLRPFFSKPIEMFHQIFLKGYQWPLDSARLEGGSSLIDLLVYRETVECRRRVFLDYRTYPDDFHFDQLPDESRQYLGNCCVDQCGTPFDALKMMNPMAISMYREHRIDLKTQPLEIALCAQHNNGGLAADHWWESENIAGLFPIGEVSGTHGIRRPGGSALNSGQVGALRAAERIAIYLKDKKSIDNFPIPKRSIDKTIISHLTNWLLKGEKSHWNGTSALLVIQERMSRVNPFRSANAIREALLEAQNQWHSIQQDGLQGSPAQILQVEQLCFAHMVYLSAMLYSVISNAGSRGSCPVMASKHEKKGTFYAHESLSEYRFIPEMTALENCVLETIPSSDGGSHSWLLRRPIPHTANNFEQILSQQNKK